MSYTTYSTRRIHSFPYDQSKAIKISAINALITTVERVEWGLISEYGTEKLMPLKLV